MAHEQAHSEQADQYDQYDKGQSTRAPSVSEPLPMDYRAGIRHVYLGESFVAYADGGGLMVLDHHAAHERVLYEKLLGGLPSEGHMLLFPQQVKLSHKEYLLVLNNTDMLMEFGMEVDHLILFVDFTVGSLDSLALTLEV